MNTCIQATYGYGNSSDLSYGDWTLIGLDWAALILSSLFLGSILYTCVILLWGTTSLFLNRDILIFESHYVWVGIWFFVNCWLEARESEREHIFKIEEFLEDEPFDFQKSYTKASRIETG